jgi:hypothetical protein
MNWKKRKQNDSEKGRNGDDKEDSIELEIRW